MGAASSAGRSLPGLVNHTLPGGPRKSPHAWISPYIVRRQSPNQPGRFLRTLTGGLALSSMTSADQGWSWRI